MLLVAGCTFAGHRRGRLPLRLRRGVVATGHAMPRGTLQFHQRDRPQDGAVTDRGSHWIRPSNPVARDQLRGPELWRHSRRLRWRAAVRGLQLATELCRRGHSQRVRLLAQSPPAGCKGRTQHHFRRMRRHAQLRQLQEPGLRRRGGVPDNTVAVPPVGANLGASCGNVDDGCGGKRLLRALRYLRHRQPLQLHGGHLRRAGRGDSHGALWWGPQLREGCTRSNEVCGAARGTRPLRCYVTHDPTKKGTPKGWRLPVRDFLIYSGASSSAGLRRHLPDARHRFRPGLPPCRCGC